MGSVPWFFAPPESWGPGEVVLPADESHHALHVMRISPPDVLTIIDGRGRLARCSASRVEGDHLITEILERDERRPLRPEIVVYQGAAKGTKVDDVIERLAELGTAEVCVYESRRSVVRWDQKKIVKLEDRWAAIARSTAKQSRNPHAIRTAGGLSWTELLRRVAREPLAVVLWEDAMLPLRTALSGPAERVALVVGPEGGLAQEEAEELADAGAQLVSLGPHILRTQNAPVVAVSAVMYHYGLIG